MEDQIYKYLKAAVELSVGDGVYRYNKVNEIEKNILEYSLKKISNLNTKQKIIITCTIIQKDDKGLQMATSIHWDQSTDGTIKYVHETNTMIILVAAYWL
ncbi:hypothetical protein BB559_005846 [Furculomyces boomerangus]|uniref:Topoisomerase I damage affected protein 2 n=2 Tax=Harpellales TaxID=61421 RepID=A0A2T9Y6C0_9FUNG|nr:hypothetical protein BB559_005846 [Furculomyces boomerangus]PWA02691.1 hypothetical protein BB558_001174 [Smittium angustum]